MRRISCLVPWRRVTTAAACLFALGCGSKVVGEPGAAGAGGSSGGESSGGSGGVDAGAAGASGSSPTRYSPDECKMAGGIPVPSPGGPQTPEKDCESGVALGVIDAASSGWDEGGLCCAVGEAPATKACGARAGDTCSAREYCAYEPGGLCGAADAESLCKPRPSACGEIYAPVCGCDRQTYENACSANAAGSGVLHEGACQ